MPRLAIVSGNRIFYPTLDELQTFTLDLDSAYDDSLCSCESHEGLHEFCANDEHEHCLCFVLQAIEETL